MENISNTANDTNYTDTGLANVKIAMYSIILVTSLVGNFFVIAVVCGTKSLRTVFNSFIVNMAISDLFIPLLALPMRISESASGEKSGLWLIGGDFGEVMCKILIVIIDASPGVTVFSLVIIAVNRFVAIVKPMHHTQLFSAKRCKILIASTWIAVTIFFTPYFHTYYTVYDGYNMCKYDWKAPFDSSKSNHIFFFTLIVIFFVAPFSSIIVLYSAIIYTLHASSKTVIQMLATEEARKRKQRNKRVFFISIAMIVAFAIFWGPFFSVLFIELATGRRFSGTVFFTVQFLGYANSAINPLIYFVFLGTFRNGFKRMFCRCFKDDCNGSPDMTRTDLLTKDNVHDQKMKKMTSHV